jgi:23S rRNA (guanosine2251-2'-O)-methyltransferase
MGQKVVMKKDFYLILPSIRSCHNVGAMFRTGDACGVTKLFLVGYTAQPPKIQIDKVSLGAELWMKWEYRENLQELILELKSQGVQVIALEKNEKSVDISEVKVTAPIALIVGNEVKGVEAETLDLCDDVVHIPMHGRKESFNVSVAAGIAMYELKKKIGQ